MPRFRVIDRADADGHFVQITDTLTGESRGVKEVDVASAQATARATLTAMQGRGELDIDTAAELTLPR